nr:hypothetical protein [uncultured Desulfobulbus sp.]
MQNALVWGVALVSVIGVVAVVRKVFPGRKTREEVKYKQLVRMLFGDMNAADRLIALEREKSPQHSRLEWIAAAITRLRNDMR